MYNEWPVNSHLLLAPDSNSLFRSLCSPFLQALYTLTCRTQPPLMQTLGSPTCKPKAPHCRPHPLTWKTKPPPSCRTQAPHLQATAPLAHQPAQLSQAAHGRSVMGWRSPVAGPLVTRQLGLLHQKLDTGQVASPSGVMDQASPQGISNVGPQGSCLQQPLQCGQVSVFGGHECPLLRHPLPSCRPPPPCAPAWPLFQLQVLPGLWLPDKLLSRWEAAGRVGGGDRARQPCLVANVLPAAAADNSIGQLVLVLLQALASLDLLLLRR